MSRCALCDRWLSGDAIVAIRGLRDVPGVTYLCRDCLAPVLRRGSLKVPAPSLRQEMDGIFGEDPE